MVSKVASSCQKAKSRCWNYCVYQSWVVAQKQHEKLSLCPSEVPSQRRAIAMDLTVLNRYFDLLEDTIKGNDLHNRPALFFNCDEI